MHNLKVSFIFNFKFRLKIMIKLNFTIDLTKLK